MNDNQNNDLNINKVNVNGTDDIFEKIKAKDNNLNNKVYDTNNTPSNNDINTNTESIAKENNQTNNPRALKEKRHKKIIIQTRIEEDDFFILKEHLLKKGYDTYSTGVRGIIKMYMRDNGLIE